MLLEIVKRYLKIFPDDAGQLEVLLDQIKDGELLNDRRNFRGHIAGDALVLSPDLKKILFIFHKRSGRWQQPGGHWDPEDEGPWVTAEREAFEETGVEIGRRINMTDDERVPLHIITGPVYPSEAKKEPHHWHHDFRYGFIAKNENLGKIQDDGIGGAKWLPLGEAEFEAGEHNTKESIERLRVLIKTAT